MSRPTLIAPALALAALLLAALLAARWLPPRPAPSCVPGPAGTSVCVTDEAQRLPPTATVPPAPWLFDPATRTVVLHGARDEVVAFQVVVRAAAAARVSVTAEPLRGPGGATLEPGRHVRRFLAHYVEVDRGAYTWGPPSRVLPWPGRYPDALVPFRTACALDEAGAPSGAPSPVVEDFPVPSPVGPSQAVWIDVHIPRDRPAGDYAGALRVEAGGASTSLPVRLTVHAATLPARPAVEAVGEVYDAWEAEGLGRDRADPAWRRMAWCAQQLAHRHRAVFIPRSDAPPDASPDAAAAWDAYDAAHAPALDGRLFTPAMGYEGPGAATPVAVWRTPWVQPWNGTLPGPLPEATVERLRERATAWARHVTARGWAGVPTFAYLFDEVDGGADTGELGADPEADAYVAMAHAQMRRVQGALDEGAGPGRATVHLLWTGHADPARWQGRPGLDLDGTIRWWAPNAAAASPGFLAGRVADGERAWFYHAGHPSIGVHAVNAPGTELRTWGVTAARYGLTGVLMWAVNLGSRTDPYGDPSYKPKDDRFGNGTLIYPGAALPTIGHPAIAEPVPSMRLKAWRRGLQDADLAAAARAAGHGAEVDRLLTGLVPRALAAARPGAAPSWPTDPAAWERARRALLALASGEASGPAQ